MNSYKVYGSMKKLSQHDVIQKRVLFTIYYCDLIPILFQYWIVYVRCFPIIIHVGISIFFPVSDISSTATASIYNIIQGKTIVIHTRYEGLLGSLFNIQFGYNEVINYVP